MIKPTPRSAAWVSIGIAWGRMTVERMKVTAPTRTYTLFLREGVAVEMPLGFGASYEILARRLAVVFETTVSRVTNQSGTLFDRVQYTDSLGRVAHAQPFPTTTSTVTQMFGLSLLL
jgi:hypothetical protein